MVNYFGRVDWELFFGVINVRCLQITMQCLIPSRATCMQEAHASGMDASLLRVLLLFALNETFRSGSRTRRLPFLTPRPFLETEVRVGCC